MRVPVNIFPIYAVALCAAGLAIVVLLSTRMTDGILIYTLDDPYIHLAVAESILEGGYGINAGEYASPSSSILYPYLLAVALLLGLGTSGPLFISGVFSILSVWVLAKFTRRILKNDATFASWVTFILMGPAVVFSLNAIALPMNGMEHTLHVFGVILTLSCLHALLVDEEGGRQLSGLLLGCLLCATVRFEGLALVFGVALVLVLAGRWRLSLVLIILVTGIFGLYSTYMINLGLPVFPSSVMTKSNVASHATEGNLFGVVKGLLRNLENALKNDRGFVIGVVLAILARLHFDSTKTREFRLFTGAITVLLLGHLLAGRYGWFGRYEIYAVAAMFIALVAILNHKTAVKTGRILAFALAALVYAVPYGVTTLRSPAASANIYQQQYQMHRFSQEFFPASVAVNDLGWVAYGNQNFVLDLWGLGSEEARQLTETGGWTPGKLTEITQRNNITYAMIYDDWFKKVPDDWCLAAQLVTSRVTAASDTVSFYLIEPGQGLAFSKALRVFSGSLPTGAHLEINAC